MIVVVEINAAGRQFHDLFCYFTVGDRDAEYVISVASTVYDQEAAVLKGIAESADVSP